MSELLDAIRAGGDIDVIRKEVEMVLQALIDREATAAISTERYERADTRTICRAPRHEPGGQHPPVPQESLDGMVATWPARACHLSLDRTTSRS